MFMLLQNELCGQWGCHRNGLSAWLEHPWSLWDVSALDASSVCGDRLFQEHGRPGLETKPSHLHSEGNRGDRSLVLYGCRIWPFALCELLSFFPSAADGGICCWIFWPKPHQPGTVPPWLWGLSFPVRDIWIFVLDTSQLLKSETSDLKALCCVFRWASSPPRTNELRSWPS